jgi:hypothetical protein
MPEKRCASTSNSKEGQNETAKFPAACEGNREKRKIRIRVRGRSEEIELTC